MKDKGMAHIGIGNAKGDEKAIEAVKLAVASPLLETTISGATHVIINISGDISLMDANDAASYVQDLAGDEANIIFGAKYDESMTDEATITVIATGLEDVSTRPAGATAASVSNQMKYYQSQQAAARQSAASAGVGRTTGAVTNGLHTSAAGTATTRTTVPTQTTAAPLNGIQRPRQPESTVKPIEINIPDFLKNTKR
jgi:cell division protein FtsZ